MYFLLALVIGMAVGALACLPEPRTDLRTASISVTLGLIGAFVGWEASVLLGEAEVSPFAQLFFAFVAAGALVSVYHAATSERAGLK